MKYLNLHNVQGFESLENVSIFDAFKKPFYKHKANGLLKFNLPKGAYFTTSNVVERQPFIYVTPEIPTPNPNVNLQPLKVVFCRNKNKCSVDLDKHVMYLDYSMLNKGQAALEFIKNHEQAHYLYPSKEETMCDLWSVRRMLETGYNPSQCLHSIDCTLSDFSDKRKQIIADFLIKTKIK